MRMYSDWRIESPWSSAHQCPSLRWRDSSASIAASRAQTIRSFRSAALPAETPAFLLAVVVGVVAVEVDIVVIVTTAPWKGEQLARTWR